MVFPQTALIKTSPSGGSVCSQAAFCAQPAKLIQQTHPLLTAAIVLARSGMGKWREHGWSPKHASSPPGMIPHCEETRGRASVHLPLSFLLSLFNLRLLPILDIPVLNRVPWVLPFIPGPFASLAILPLSKPFQSFPSLPSWIPHPFHQSSTTAVFIAPWAIFASFMAVSKPIFSEGKTGTGRSKGLW